MSDYEKTLDIIFDRWKSQILYAGVKLGIFDSITKVPKLATDISKENGLDNELTYRLLRALASLGFLEEDSFKRFSLSAQGEFLRKDHPQTLRGIILLEEGAEHYQIWKHLPEMVKDGQQNSFVREYGLSAFEYAKRNSEYGKIFNQAMTSYSNMHTNWVLDALDEYDFSKIRNICDIGGGHGHLISNLLLNNSHMRGSVLDLQYVIDSKEQLWANKIGVQDRCQYISGDMFSEVPSADAYLMKMILHDWNDAECVNILLNANLASSVDARIFIIEHLIPGPQSPHFSKLFDIHMMCWGSGKERTVDEYSALLEQSGWKYVQTFYPSKGIIGVIEGIKSKK